MGKLAVSETTTYRWSFEEDVRRYLRAGIPAIGVWRQKLSDFGEEQGAELLKEVGLEVSSLLWAGGFTGSDGRSYRESVLDAHDAIRLAGRLRTPNLIVYSGGRAGHTHNHARRLFKSALRELLPFASEFGVTLAVEPMHPGCAAEWTFLTSVEETLELIEEIDDRALQIAFDTYHLLHDFEPQRLESLIHQIAIVHVGDAKEPPHGEQNRCRLGDGELRLAQLVQVLNSCGYEGFLEVELMGEEVETSAYEDLLAHSKRVLESWGVSNSAPSV